MNSALVNTAYWGPVNYYAIFAFFSKVSIEQSDHYSKQTYRNRCRILGANGMLSLTVPVVKLSGKKQQLKDVRIDYATRWQTNHWRSIVSAYRSSPFFEYYQDQLAQFYHKRREFLIDLNSEIHQFVCTELELDNESVYTDTYKHRFDGYDFRDVLSPKHEKKIDGVEWPLIEYTQTFHEKMHFVPRLSILDLLCNCGPESNLVLEQSIKID
jgi:hypothetical protein